MRLPHINVILGVLDYILLVITIKLELNNIYRMINYDNKNILLPFIKTPTDYK